MSKIKIIEILNGHINVVLGINSELSDYRIENACKNVIYLIMKKVNLLIVA